MDETMLAKASLEAISLFERLPTSKRSAALLMWSAALELCLEHGVDERSLVDSIYSVARARELEILDE